MRIIKQGTANRALVFLMVDSTDHITGKTGLTPTVTLSKNGGTFASPSGAVSEIGNGLYKVAGDATDSATLGSLVLHATGTGADPCDIEFEVVAFDPQDSVRMGLTALPNVVAGGLNGLPLSVDTSGRVEVLKINGFTQTGRDLGNSVLLSSGTGTGQVKLSLGYVGIDWGDIANKATANAFTNTSIASVSGSVGSVTGAVGSVTGAVGSVTGNVGGSVASVTGDVGGKVLGGGSGTIVGDGVRASSVTGNVGGNVVGSVASVTGNVGGNVTGSVGSVTGNVGGNVVGSVASVTGDVAGKVLGGGAGTITGDGVRASSVTGNVGGNVTGTVGSVTGNVGGNVVGSVASVTGNVAGNVVGSVGSVTGNVGGNVTGTVGSVSNPASIWAALTSGLTTVGSVGKLLVDNVNATISSRSTLTATDVWSHATRTLTSFGTLVADVWSYATRTLTLSPLNASDVWTYATRELTSGSNISLAKGTGVTGFNDLSQADVRSAVGLASANLDTQLAALPTAAANADAVWDEVMSGHTGSTTYGGRIIRAANSNVTTFITGAQHIAADIHELQPAVINNTHFDVGAIDSNALATSAATEIADSILGRNIAGGSDGGRMVKDAFRFLRNRFAVVGTTLTVYQEDDTTAAWTATVTATAGADPITASDPAGP